MDPTNEIERLPTRSHSPPAQKEFPPGQVDARAGRPVLDPGGIPPFADLLAEANAPAAPLPAGRRMQGPPVQLPTVAEPGRTRSDPPTGEAGAIEAVSTERRIGPYHVLEELGSGGMAIVYKAIQPSLDRVVAIKELRPEYVHDRQIAARFAREATSLATLQHGNIVHIFDYLFDKESAHIVMEYVEGIDLFDLLAATNRLPPEVAAIIAGEVAEGLEYAHYRGIVHRDIKPSNILISKHGEVKVMDFGIARDPGNSELTQVGIAVGTPAYMAPEQIRGDKIDFRTDIFALGILLYEMLTGEKPWPEEEGRSVTVKVLDEEYRPIRDLYPAVPRELERAIDKCLEKNPQDRYATTYDLRRELETFVHRMVPIDPRGRLVLFLRNRSFVKDGEAANLVPEALLEDAAVKRRDQGIPLPPAEALLKPVGVMHLLAATAIGIAGLLAAFLPVGQKLSSDPPHVVLADGEAATVPLPATETKAEGTPAPILGARRALAGNEGFVKVIVDPWARVFVDGEFYDLTPFAEPIAMAPGTHRLAFRNPYFKSSDQMVEVREKVTQTVKVSLLAKDEGDEQAESQR
jgi:serine/threonine-protein kinase